MKIKYQRKFNAAIIILSICLCAGVALFAKNKIDNAIAASGSAEIIRPMIVLDAGQEAYVVSIVV